MFLIKLNYKSQLKNNIRKLKNIKLINYSNIKV